MWHGNTTVRFRLKWLSSPLSSATERSASARHLDLHLAAFELSQKGKRHRRETAAMLLRAPLSLPLDVKPGLKRTAFGSYSKWLCPTPAPELPRMCGKVELEPHVALVHTDADYSHLRQHQQRPGSSSSQRRSIIGRGFRMPRFRFPAANLLQSLLQQHPAAASLFVISHKRRPATACTLHISGHNITASTREGRTRSLFHCDHSSFSVFKSRLSFCASYAPRRHIHPCFKIFLVPSAVFHIKAS